jgi:hypothetical protein
MEGIHNLVPVFLLITPTSLATIRPTKQKWELAKNMVGGFSLCIHLLDITLSQRSLTR